MTSGDRDIEIWERLFPLIAEWGTAIEEGRNAAVPLAALVAEFNSHPDDLKYALEMATLYQEGEMKRAVDPKDSPSHPKQRLARIVHLEGMLYAHTYDQP